MKRIILFAIIFLLGFSVLFAEEIQRVNVEYGFSETFYKNDIEMVSVVVCTKEGRSEEVKSLLNSIENVRISFEINNFLGADIPIEKLSTIKKHPESRLTLSEKIYFSERTWAQTIIPDTDKYSLDEPIFRKIGGNK